MFSKLFLLSFIAIAYSRPDGSPLCELPGDSINHHGQLDSELKYTLDVSSNGKTATIKVSDEFIGLLLYVTDGSGNKVGTFESPSSDFQILSDCEGSTITHSNNKGKKGEFKWAITEGGAYKVNAVVMKSQSSWNKFTTDLQIESGSTEANAGKANYDATQNDEKDAEPSQTEDQTVAQPTADSPAYMVEDDKKSDKKDDKMSEKKDEKKGGHSKSHSRKQRCKPKQHSPQYK